MPLSMLNIGDIAIVSLVKGNEKTKKHLENLGFVSNSAIMVIAINDGDMIVKIKDAKVALGRDMTSKIIVTPQ